MTVPAGIIRYLHMAAVVALIFMAAEEGSSADLDGVHDSQRITRQPMGFSIGRTVLTEDLRHLKATRGSHPLSGLGNGFECSVERTDYLGQVQPTDMQIDGGRGGRSEPQKHLDMMEVGSRFNQVGGEAMP